MTLSPSTAVLRAASAALLLALAACGPELATDDALAPRRATAAAQALEAGGTTQPDLVITEVMADPAVVDDTVGEWFELHNPGTEPVDLEDWTVLSNNDSPHTITTSVVVPPGGYVVVGRSTDAASNGGVSVAYAYGASLNLANGSDWVSLQNPDGRVVDTAAWTSSAPRGASRALVNPACDNAEVHGAAWATSTVTFGAGDKGTPAAVNGEPLSCPPPPPVLPRDVRFNEVLADPQGVADSAGEWLELHNPGAVDVDLMGWKLVSTESGTLRTHVIAAHVVVPAQGYAVLGNNANASTNGSVAVAYGYGTALTLSNSSDLLELRRPDDEVVDRVTWNTSPPGGSSRALIKPDAPNAGDVGGSAWATSTLAWAGKDRGSPGVANPAPKPGVSVLINDPARLPVGYVKPAFPTVRDANGVVMSPTPPLTWSSSDESVAVVDPRGYVTAVGVGTVSIRAELEDGTRGSAFLTVVPATADTPAVYGNHVEFGAPQDADARDDVLVQHPQYTLSFNPLRGGPNWVSWELNATHFGSADRCNCFTPDPLLPADVVRVEDADYRNGGYDRGHMVQSFNRTSTEQENAATYLTSNILPQAAENNQGPWAKLETHLSDLARTGGKEVYIVAGGWYPATPATLKDEGRVAIPDYTWKVAVVVDAGEGLADVRGADDVQVLAVWMPNRVGAVGAASADGIRNRPWQDFETTVDAIEARTGYDLLALLPDALERIVEARDRFPVAHVAAPAAALEGSALVLDASGSSDPDGDALEYAWTFGDGTQATGPTVTHTFADDGAYTATVTVTDPYGATSTASTTVTVANVAPALGALPSATLLPGETFAGFGAFADPGADTWTGSVTYGDGSPASALSFLGRVFGLTHTYVAAGSYAVTVSLQDDDGGSDTATTTVVVLTPQQALLDLEAQVPARSLLAKLQAARKQLDAGHAGPAANQLGAFVNEVEAMARSGRLASSRADAWGAAAQRIVRSL